MNFFVSPRSFHLNLITVVLLAFFFRLENFVPSENLTISHYCSTIFYARRELRELLLAGGVIGDCIAQHLRVVPI